MMLTYLFVFYYRFNVLASFDLETKVFVPFATAMLGESVQVEVLGAAGTVQIAVQCTFGRNTEVRVPNFGLRKPGSNEARGDLICTVHVGTPFD
jgi:DnaJ-class molecular chaperone